MTDMPTAPAHAKPAPRDHLWVLVIIAVCCLVKVWPSWVGIGAEAGFPDFGKIPTDWTLAVVIEAYWAYAVYAWLAAPAGKRSRLFAMWSAAGVFALSLVGQSAAQVMAAKAVDVFANALPVLVLALIAILVHLRRHDRDDAETAERKRAGAERAAAAEAVAADERTTLRAELEAALAALEPAQTRAAEAEAAAVAAGAKAAELARKLEAARPRKRPRRAAPQRPAAGTRKPPRSEAPADPAEASAEDPATEVPNDVDAQAEALAILADEPDISGAKLAERVGMSERWGQTLKKNLAARTAGPDGPSGPA